MTKPLPLNELQREVLTLLTTESTRLRWHSYQTPKKAGNRGRGQIVGIECAFNETQIPASAVRNMIRRGLIKPASRIDAQPFKPGVTHRDYVITDYARAELGRSTP